MCRLDWAPVRLQFFAARHAPQAGLSMSTRQHYGQVRTEEIIKWQA